MIKSIFLVFSPNIFSLSLFVSSHRVAEDVDVTVPPPAGKKTHKYKEQDIMNEPFSFDQLYSIHSLRKTNTFLAIQLFEYSY